MAIQISSDGRTFTLQTEKSSYQMMADAHDVLLHLYYGRKIHPAIDGLMEQHAFAPGNTNIYDSEHLQFSLEDACLEMSSFGKGDIREPFVELTLSDGSETSDSCLKNLNREPERKNLRHFRDRMMSPVRWSGLV